MNNTRTQTMDWLRDGDWWRADYCLSKFGEMQNQNLILWELVYQR